MSTACRSGGGGSSTGTGGEGLTLYATGCGLWRGVGVLCGAAAAVCAGCEVSDTFLTSILLLCYSSVQLYYSCSTVVVQ
jgi:hypothetical protein